MPALRRVFAVQGVVAGSWPVHLPFVKQRLGLTDPELGLCLFVSATAALAATVATGRLLGRWSDRRVTVVATAVCAPAGVGLALAPDPVLFTLAASVWAGGVAAADVGVNTQAVTLERASGRLVMGSMHGAWSLGALGGAALGGAAVAAHAPMTAQQVLVGVVAVTVTLACSARYLPREPAGQRPSPAGPRRGLPGRAVLVLGVMMGLALLCEGATNDWGPVLMHDEVGAPRWLTGGASVACGAGLLASRLVFDRLAGVLGHRRVIRGALLVGTAGCTAGLLSLEPAVVVAGFFLLGCGIGVVAPAALSQAGRQHPQDAPAAVAAVAGIGWFGFVAGPAAIGLLTLGAPLHRALLLLPAGAAAIAGLTAVSLVRWPERSA